MPTVLDLSRIKMASATTSDVCANHDTSALIYSKPHIEVAADTAHPQQNGCGVRNKKAVAVYLPGV